MILSHVWGLFAHPREEFEVIQKEQADSPKLYIFYMLVLSAIPPICGYIGATQVGWIIGDHALTKLTVESAIPLSIVAYFAIVAGIVSTGIAIDWMRENYTELNKRELSGMAMATYITMPLLVLSVIGIYPVIWIGMITLIIAASYSVYLLYAGVPIAFQIPEERAAMFSSAILTFALVISVVLMIATVIIWGIGFSPVFTN